MLLKEFLLNCYMFSWQVVQLDFVQLLLVELSTCWIVFMLNKQMTNGICWDDRPPWSTGCATCYDDLTWRHKSKADHRHCGTKAIPAVRYHATSCQSYVTEVRHLLTRHTIPSFEHHLSHFLPRPPSETTSFLPLWPIYGRLVLAFLGTRAASAANLIISKRWSFYIFSVHGGGDSGEEAERASGVAWMHRLVTQPFANILQWCSRGDNERPAPVRASVEVGVPYQAGTEAATAAAVNGGRGAAAPLGPLDNVRMAHLLPSAKTSVAQK